MNCEVNDCFRVAEYIIGFRIPKSILYPEKVFVGISLCCECYEKSKKVHMALVEREEKQIRGTIVLKNK